MKITLFILMFVGVYHTGNAQISIHITSPKSGQSTGASDLSFYLQNDGIDTLQITDTILFTVPRFGATAYVGYYLEPQDTLQFNYSDMPIDTTPYCITIDVLHHNTDMDCVELTTGIKNVPKLPLFYPNPAHGYVFSSEYVVICDMTGRVVSKGIGRLDVCNLSGIYIVNRKYKLLVI